MSSIPRFRHLIFLHRVSNRAISAVPRPASLLLQPKGSARCFATPAAVKNAVNPDENYSTRQARRDAGSVANGNNQQNKRRDVGSELDRMLAKMDIDVKRLGRVNLFDFTARMEDLKRCEKISSQTALLMIRCCGSLLVELKPEDRIKLSDELWSRLQSTVSRLDISHYNALLKVHLENNREINPTEFLATLSEKGIEPNRVTYQRLIAYYCQRGDIAGATQILEFMKTKDFPINENVFSALIQGYARAGDMENSVGILEVMRSSQLEPSALTYKTLCEAFAEKGDIPSVMKYTEEAEQKGAALSDADYFDVIQALAANGHSDHIPKVFEKIRKTPGYYQDALNAVSRLLDVGADEAAYRILEALPSSKEGQDRSGFGALFIRKLIRYNYPMEKIVNHIEALKASDKNPFALERATESAFSFGNTDYALKFIMQMRDSGKEIRPHYFWPIFATHRKNNDVKGIWDTLRIMNEMGVSPSLETLTDYILPALKGMSSEEIIEEFRVRFPIISIINPLVVCHLENGKIKEATKLLQEHNIRVNPTITIRPLAEGYLKNENFSELEGMLRYLSRLPSDQGNYDFAGQLVLTVINQVGLDEKILLKLLTSFSGSRLRISPEVANQIDARFRGKTPERISVLLEQLVSRDQKFRGSGMDPEFGKHPRDMSIEELEEHLLELKSKNMNTRGVLRRLLVEHARMRNVKRAEQIRAELEAQKSEFSGAMYAQLMDMYAQNGNLEEALKTLKAAEAADKDFVVDAYKVMNLAALMLSKGQTEDAIKLLDDYRQKRGKTLELEGLERNVFRVLNAAAEKGDAALVKKLWEEIGKMGEFKPNNLVCGPLVKVHVVKNDLPSAMEAFEECVTRYEQTPWKGELMKRLIEVEDTANLQKLMDLSTKIHGDVNSLYDLAFAFIEAGRVKQAQKIFDTPGLRARHDRLDAFCNRAMENNRPQDIETLLAASKDLFDIDRDLMYYYLVRMYGKLGQPDKALSVWTSMQEENIQPSIRTLRALANVLREHKREVPFEVPEEVSSRDETVTKDEAELMKLIREDDPDAALDQKRKMDSTDQTLSIRGYSHLIELLLQKERVKEALNLTNELLERGNHPFPAVSKFLLNKLSRAGEVDVMEDLLPRLPEKLGQYLRLNKHLFSCYVHANRSSEILSRYENGDIKDTIPISSVIELLEKSPDLMPRVKDIAERSAQLGDYRAALAVWSNLFSSGDYDEAKRLLEKYPDMSQRLRAIAVCEAAHKKNDQMMLRKLIEILREYSRPNVALAYSYLIGLNCHNRDYDAALNVLKEATDGAGLALHEMRLTALRVLEKGLTELGKPVPFKVPEPSKMTAEGRVDEEDQDVEPRKQRFRQ